MKRGTKIALWVAGVVVGLVVLFVTCADVTVSRIAEKKAREAIAQAELPFVVEFKHIHVLLMSKCVEVDGIHFGADDNALKSKKIDTVDVRVPKVAIRNIHYMDFIRHKKVSIGSVKIKKACAELKGKSNKLAVEVRRSFFFQLNFLRKNQFI